MEILLGVTGLTWLIAHVAFIRFLQGIHWHITGHEGRAAGFYQVFFVLAMVFNGVALILEIWLALLVNGTLRLLRSGKRKTR